MPAQPTKTKPTPPIAPQSSEQTPQPDTKPVDIEATPKPAEPVAKGITPEIPPALPQNGKPEPVEPKPEKAEQKPEPTPKPDIKEEPEKPEPSVVSPPPAPTPAQQRPTDDNIIKTLLTKARAKIQSRRQKRLDKILLALKEKGKLSNKEIRGIAKKSRWTTRRYMDILEKQGRVKQVGKTGKHTHYELI